MTSHSLCYARNRGQGRFPGAITRSQLSPVLAWAGANTP